MQSAPTIGDVPSRLHGLRFAVRDVSRGTWVRGGILVFFCTFYIWTAATSEPIHFTSGADGVYGRIADSLLHGRLYLAEAPAGLTELDNPFDPAENLPFRFPSDAPPNHDLSLHGDKLYAYWGPAPAILLFAPARLLGFAFSQSLAVALFGFLALVFGTLTLLTLQRRFAPEAPAWKVNVAIVCLGFANVIPYIARRPGQYEVAIAAGLFFVLLATWLMLTALLRDDAERRPDLRRLALASLALGLAVGSRPSHVVAAAGLVVLAGWRLRRIERTWRPRLAAALLGPLLACGVLLALYNIARFGSPTEFGLSHQLAGVDVTKRDTFSLSYLLPGLWYYLVAPLRPVMVFPFIKLPPPGYYPGHVPAVYDGVEPTGGLFALAPILLILPVALFRRRLEADLRAVLLTFTVIAAGLAVVASIAFWGVTMRYEGDFASLLLIGALTLWLRSRVRWAAIAGTVAIGWASLVGLAISFTGAADALRTQHPKLWEALTRDFSPVSRWIANVAYGGPAIAEINGPTSRFDRTGLDYRSLGDQGVHFTVSAAGAKAVVVMPAAGETRLRMRVWRGPAVAPGTRIDLGFALPDGHETVVSLTERDQEIDVRLRLDRGVQEVTFVPLLEAQPAGDGMLLEVDRVRVEGLVRGERR